MKRFLHYIIVFLLSLTASTVLANDVYTVNGINFLVDSTKMEAIVESGDYTGSINIPAYVDIEGKNYSVTALESYAFSRCDKLTNVSIPNSVRMIGPGCFAFCTSLTSLTIPNSVRNIGILCFYECSNLSSIDLPKNIKDLEGVFYHCTGLKSIIIPDSVKSLSTFVPKDDGDMRPDIKGCFAGCTNLTNIVIPNSVTSFGDGCFVDCSSLKNINIPNSVTSLGKGCFYGCISLTSITIPKSVVFLGSECIDGCPNLNEVTCQAIVPPTIDYAYSLNNKTLYVPEKSIEAYKTAKYWKDFEKILPISASGIKSISPDDKFLAIKDGRLLFRNSNEKEKISVYSTTGELLGCGNGNISISVKGHHMVIVKIGKKSSCLLIK